MKEDKVIHNPWSDDPKAWMYLKEYKLMKKYGDKANKEAMDKLLYGTHKPNTMNKAEQSIIQEQNVPKKFPGISGSGTTFNLVFKEDWWKSENLEINEKYVVKILEVYKFTWWKRILFKLGFSFCHFKCTLI